MSDVIIGNYSVKFIEQMTKTMKALPAADAVVVGSLIGSIRTAPHFALPDCGQLLERRRETLDVDPNLLRPPFPIVVLEYQALNGGMAEDEIRSSKRIVVVSELNGSVGIVPIWYIDDDNAWRMPLVAMKLSVIEKGMVGGNRVDILPFLPSAMENFKSLPEHKRNWLIDGIKRDISDELLAYVEFCQILACANVSMQERPASRALNANRVRARKQKLFDYKVLTIPGGGSSGHEGTGTHRSPRAHLRRGHIRRLSETRQVWVNATYVKGNGEGFVHKSYNVVPKAVA